MFKNQRNISTYNVKVVCNKQTYNSIVETLRKHNDIWNDVSAYIYASYTKDKKIPSLKVAHNDNYYRLKKKHNTKSQIIIKAEQSALSTYQSIKSNKKIDDLSSHAVKKRLSMQLDKRIFRFIDYDKISITTIAERAKCKIKVYDKFLEMLLKYKVLDPSIFEKDGQIWLSVPFEMPTPEVIERSCIGVDLGIKRFATTSEGISINTKKYNKIRRRLRYNKRMLQRHKKSSSARKKLKSLKRKERNLSTEMCRKSADTVLRTKANIIVLEDLSKIKGKTKKSKRFNNKHSQVPYYKFKQILSHKALRKGKKVVTVNPYMTSQNDYRGIKMGTRQGCKYIASDNKLFDADWNASINIGKKYNPKLKLPVLHSEPKFGSLKFVTLYWQATSTSQ